MEARLRLTVGKTAAFDAGSWTVSRYGQSKLAQRQARALAVAGDALLGKRACDGDLRQGAGRQQKAGLSVDWVGDAFSQTRGLAALVSQRQGRD